MSRRVLGARRLHVTEQAPRGESGKLRVVDAQAGAKCASGEKRLAWNQQGPAGPAGPQGPTGAQGEPGPAGPPGESGITGYELVTAVSAADSTADKQIEASCPAGKKAISGGVTIREQTDIGLRPIPGVSLVTSAPADLGGGWSARAAEDGPTDARWFVLVQAVCADAG